MTRELRWHGLQQVKILKVPGIFTVCNEAHYKKGSSLLLRTLIIKLRRIKPVEEVWSWV